MIDLKDVFDETSNEKATKERSKGNNKLTHEDASFVFFILFPKQNPTTCDVFICRELISFRFIVPHEGS